MLNSRSRFDNELSPEERTIVEILRYLDDAGFDDQFRKLAEEVQEKNMKLWDIYDDLS